MNLTLLALSLPVWAQETCEKPGYVWGGACDQEVQDNHGCCPPKSPSRSNRKKYPECPVKGQVHPPTNDEECCWPKQGWSTSKGECVGPPACPADMVASGDDCLKSPVCSGGQELTQDRLHCCWPGQEWDDGRCEGTPTCPPGTGRSGSSCKASPTCSTGLELTADLLHCCWPGQSWKGGECSGTPSADADYWEETLDAYYAKTALLRTETQAGVAKKTAQEGEALANAWPQLASDLEPHIAAAWEKYWKLRLSECKTDRAAASREVELAEERLAAMEAKRTQGNIARGSLAAATLLGTGVTIYAMKKMEASPRTGAIAGSSAGVAMLSGLALLVTESWGTFHVDTSKAMNDATKASNKVNKAEACIAEAESKIQD